MNKFSSIFGQILQIFSRNEFYRAVMETGAEKGAKGFYLLAAVCSDAVLPNRAGPFLEGDMRRARKLSWKNKTPWHWINNPYEMPQIVPDAEQFSLRDI